MTTKITPSVLENTTVTPSTYGTASQVSTVTVDAQGRVTGASNTSIAIGTSQITSGTLADARLPDQSGLTAAAYFGDATKTVAIVTDAKGRIKSASNVAIAISSGSVSGLATSATTDTSNATNISSGTLAAARLADSGVSATTYGSASNVSRVTVDAKGRITGASNVAIQIATSQITGYPSFAASATTDTTNASNITSGTLPAARIPNTTVTSGSYGSGSVVPAITVDSTGRITAVTATNIGIAAGAVSGLSSVATSGSYNDLSNKPSIPAAQVNSDWNATTGLAQILNKPTIPTVPTNVSSFTNDSGYLTSATVPGGASGVKMQIFTDDGTFTVPAGITNITVLLWGGGGGGENGPGTSGGLSGGAGGVAAAYLTVSPGQAFSVVIGRGGNSATAGGTSSFGLGVSATGGAGGGGGNGYGVGSVSASGVAAAIKLFASAPGIPPSDKLMGIGGGSPGAQGGDYFWGELPSGGGGPGLHGGGGGGSRANASYGYPGAPGGLAGGPGSPGSVGGSTTSPYSYAQGGTGGGKSTTAGGSGGTGGGGGAIVMW